jgi:hypothetical protein
LRTRDLGPALSEGPVRVEGNTSGISIPQE